MAHLPALIRRLWYMITLNRVPAKEMTCDRKEHGIDNRFVETRSMFAVKLGFVSLKYGVLVHWNVHTGLAELILLRKLCPESFSEFMKSNPPREGRKKVKSWMKSRRNLL